MRNVWLVAKKEYQNTVARRAFVLLTLAVPAAIVLIIGAGAVIGQMGEDDKPLGYVDQAGILDPSRHAALAEANERVQIVPFADVESAQAALEGEQIQAFFVFPPDYPRSLATELYYLQTPPGNSAWEDMDDFVRLNLVSPLPEEVQQRLLEGPDVTVHELSSGREFSEKGVVNIVLPFVATFFFTFATMSAAGYMLGVVANEKENRTMEVLITTVTPGQLIGGKTLGLLAASLTQLAVYVVAAIVAITVAAPSIPELAEAQVPWGYLGIMALFFIPAYALLAGLMIAIGAAVTELQQGQQVAGLLNLVFLAPLFALPLYFANASHPAVVAMTLFPPTSFLSISLRWGLGSIPVWQLVASWLLLVGAGLVTIWMAGRIVRVGMLTYGQPLSLRAMAAAVRGTQE